MMIELNSATMGSHAQTASVGLQAQLLRDDARWCDCIVDDEVVQMATRVFVVMTGDDGLQPELSTDH